VRRTVIDIIDRGLAVGSRPTDDAQTRLRKRSLLLFVWTITLLAPPWVIVYLALDRPLSAAIPLGYEVFSVLSIAVIARRGWSDLFRRSQILLILMLPALLQWSLGGFVYGSAVIIWAFTAAVGALVFGSRRQALLTFGAFVALVLVSGMLDARLMEAAEPLPAVVIRTFFVLNVLAVGLVAFGGFLYFIHQRDQALADLRSALHDLDVERARSEGLLRNILPDGVADRLKDGHQIVADRYEAVTVVFADIVGLAPMAARLPPDEVVGLLDGVFSELDVLAESFGLLRIKTMGDAYMAAAGVPDPLPAADGAKAAASMALALVAGLRASFPDVQVRVGIHTGPAGGWCHRSPYLRVRPLGRCGQRRQPHGVARLARQHPGLGRDLRAHPRRVSLPEPRTYRHQGPRSDGYVPARSRRPIPPELAPTPSERTTIPPELAPTHSASRSPRPCGPPANERSADFAA
jgi:guanylate cyclase